VKESRKYNRSLEKVAVPTFSLLFHHSQLRIARTFTKRHWSLTRSGKTKSQINLFS